MSNALELSLLLTIKCQNSAEIQENYKHISCSLPSIKNFRLFYLVKKKNLQINISHKNMLMKIFEEKI